MENMKELQKKEALERIKILELHQNVYDEFLKEEKLNVSEKGILFWENEEQQKMIDEWEKETENLVYHVIHNFTEFGELYSFLYVSKHEEEWETDREDLKHGYALVYVKNITDEYCSEYGSIGIKKFIGGLIRVA